MSKFFPLLFLLSVILFFFSTNVNAEFYKYVDEKGSLHFVDDISTIPVKYRDNLTVYEDKYDHLSEEEKSLMLKKEKRETDKIHKPDEAPENNLRKNTIENSETTIVVEKNHVLVPVELGYRGRSIKALLLLDTGASLTALHQDISEKLYITQTRKTSARVVGGKVIQLKLAKLDYIKAGPFKMENIDVGIIANKGRAVKHNGLLGMDFLRNIDYRINFDKKIIHWKHRP